ncbi:MAG: gliding motility-associated C-terminal domain-containing protein [Bacteroidota bacterium]
MNSFSGFCNRGQKLRRALTLCLITWASLVFSQGYHDISLSFSATPAVVSIGDTVTFSIEIFNEGQTDLTGLTISTGDAATFPIINFTTPANTTFNTQTGIWEINDQLNSNTSFLQLEMKVIAINEGIMYQMAEVKTMSEIDVDSEPDNQFLLEDDMSAACVSVPYQICGNSGETITMEAPSGFTDYQWFHDSGSGPELVSIEQTYVSNLPGEYTYTVTGNSCPQGLCCPIIIEENCQANQPPVAWVDEVVTPPNTPIDIDILVNDSDPNDGIDTSSTNITDPPTNGTANVNPDGTITYTPDPDFAGQDTLIYEICDHGIPSPVLCDTALVIVTVGDFFFDLSLEKSLAPNQSFLVDLGEEVTYFLTLTNEGAFAATNIEVTDYIPQGMAISQNNNGWLLNPDGSVTYTVTDILNPGESIDIEIILRVVYGASGQTILNVAEVTGATDENGVVGLDIDSTPDNGDENEDDMDDQPIELVPHDPTGYVYCDKTGLIITGGTISVTGPGEVFIIHDGSTGYYEFYTDGTPGLYHLSYNHPDGMIMSDQCLPQPGSFDPTGMGTSVTLGVGSDANNTYLLDTTCTINPFYLSFDLEPGDPPVFNNNLPMQCGYIGSVVCEDEGNGVQDGTEPGLEGIIVNLFDCTDTTVVLMTTVTDVNGQYEFDGLVAGNYFVQFELPPNSRFAEGGAVDQNGFSDCIVLDFGDCDTTTSACILACPAIEAGPDLETCFGEPVAIQASLPYGNGTVTWTPATGLSDPSILNPLANPSASTLYNVRYDDGLGCVSEDSLLVNITTQCQDLLVEDTVTVQANCEYGDPLFCFDVPYVELSNYSFELNGEPYQAEFGPCDYLRERYYAIGALVAVGNRNFRLDYWNANGQVLTTTFQNVEELIDLMNELDPLGNWELNPFTLSLEGGVRQSYYSSLQITDLEFGTIYDFTLYQHFAPNSSYVILPEGDNDLVITRLDDGVTDTVHIRAFCVTPDFVEMTMPVGSIDTICFDLSEMNGEVAAIFNPCLGGIDNAAEFEEIESEVCVEVFGMFPGETEACYVTCDELGVCDTTYIYINVFNEDFHLEPDSVCTPKEVPVIAEVLLNDQINAEITSVGIIDHPEHGTVLVMPDNTIQYIPDEGYCNDGEDEPLDEFVYEVCTPFACESTSVSILVKCDGLIIYNGFSPNGDGVNDTFKIEGLDAYENHKLIVFNRWGNKVLQSDDYNNDWDGYWEDKRLPFGTYFYLIELNDGEIWMSGYLQIWW